MGGASARFLFPTQRSPPGATTGCTCMLLEDHQAEPLVTVTRGRFTTVLRSAWSMFLFLWHVSPGLLAATTILPLLQAALPGVQIYVTRALVDAVAHVFQTGGESLATATRLMALQLMLVLTSGVLTGSGHVLIARLQQRAAFAQERNVSAKAGQLPLSCFDSPEFMDRLHRTSGGFRGTTLVTTILHIMQHCITVVIYLVMLAEVHWGLSLGLIAALMPSFVANLRVSEWRFRQMHRQTPTSRAVTYLSHLLRGREAAKELRLFDLNAHLLNLWGSLYWKNANEKWQLERRAVTVRLGVESLSSTATVVCSLLVLWLGTHGQVTLGTYVAIAQALDSGRGLMQQVATSLGHVYEDALYASEYLSFLDLPEEQVSAQCQPVPQPLQQGIVVEDLSFSYPNHRSPVLKGISFAVKPGQRVAIVGDNGAGKSTLAKCLLGLYRPASGSVRFDGIDLRDLDPADLRRQVSAVFQDFVRYQLTVRENIGFGQVLQLHDTARLQVAAGKGAADELVLRLPGGYDTLLGPLFFGGHELSHGQWQKIALSRAFFRDAQVIVLDEPTAALDPTSEAAVFERFAQLAEGKTAFMISHRLASCRHADLILVLKEGQLVEAGTHTDLMGRNGEYARMVRLQAKLSV